MLPLQSSSPGAAAASSLSAALVATPVAFVSTLTILFVAGQVCGSQPLGEIDLCSDGVCQVADHENVLDVIVEIVLDL